MRQRSGSFSRHNSNTSLQSNQIAMAAAVAQRKKIEADKAAQALAARPAAKAQSFRSIVNHSTKVNGGTSTASSNSAGTIKHGLSSRGRGLRGRGLRGRGLNRRSSS